MNCPEPVSRSTSVTGSPGDRCAQNSLIPPAKWNSASRPAVRVALLVPAGLAVGLGRSSAIRMVRPGTR